MFGWGKKESNHCTLNRRQYWETETTSEHKINIPSDPENVLSCLNPIPNGKFQTSELIEFADDNFKFNENGKKLSKWVEKHCWKKGEIAHYVFKWLLRQTYENQGLFGKG